MVLSVKESLIGAPFEAKVVVAGIAQNVLAAVICTYIPR